VETAVISYRVADFLKRYAPFNAVDEADLLALAGGGKVRFYEPNEYVLWQGEPHKLHVFVIQQGTVALWDEQHDTPALRDVRGAGDMLGLERYNDARSCLYSARTESDVVVYTFPAEDFEGFVLKYPRAAEYVAAEGRVVPDYRPIGARQEPPAAFLHEFARRPPVTCAGGDSLSDAARHLLATRADALLVLGDDQRPRGVLLPATFLQWVAGGAGDPQARVDTLLNGSPATLAPAARVADGVLAMAAADADALVITDDGTPAGRAQALVSRGDLRRAFSDDPTEIVRQCRTAADIPSLRALNTRARAFLLAQLASASGVDWLARFASLVDDAILTRAIVLAGAEATDACWCVGGATGRRESLTTRAPTVMAVFSDGAPAGAAAGSLQQVLEALANCGYLMDGDRPFEAGFLAADAGEWTARYRAWIEDPVGQDAHGSRALFDVRPVCGRQELWRAVESSATTAVNSAFVHLMANDCLDSLPPLTFFQDAVVDAFGDQTDTFQLERSSLQPLVDVGRVFGLAARAAFGHSTLERFATARALLPEHDAIFREAADTLRVVLWQQGRVGIGSGGAGRELPAALLGRHDRQILKSGFRSILRLVELTANREWLPRL
jgi:CBS domain-containing protein